MTIHRRPLPDPVGIAEPPRPEIAAAIARNEAQALDAALARVSPDRLPRLLGEALARRFGRAQGRRIADLAGGHAWES